METVPVQTGQRPPKERRKDPSSKLQSRSRCSHQTRLQPQQREPGRSAPTSRTACCRTSRDWGSIQSPSAYHICYSAPCVPETRPTVPPINACRGEPGRERNGETRGSVRWGGEMPNSISFFFFEFRWFPRTDIAVRTVGITQQGSRRVIRINITEHKVRTKKKSTATLDWQQISTGFQSGIALYTYVQS
ncbi:hypothetical protein LX36DRAFT_193470 [Colletotrichum falcatum]|nr:hypothetical protein LX36DRAFT_193470 [Colletotrichum falcatum]